MHILHLSYTEGHLHFLETITKLIYIICKYIRIMGCMSGGSLVSKLHVKAKIIKISYIMPPKLDRWLEGSVTTLSEEKYSYSEICKRCKIKVFSISKKEIFSILHQQGKLGNSDCLGVHVGKTPHPMKYMSKP